MNSYFREVFTVKSTIGLLDFEPPRTLLPPTLIGSHQQTSDHSLIEIEVNNSELTPHQEGYVISDLGTMDGKMNCFPCSILEEILKHLDAWSLCQASQVNKAFNKVCEGQR